MNQKKSLFTWVIIIVAIFSAAAGSFFLILGKETGKVTIENSAAIPDNQEPGQNSALIPQEKESPTNAGADMVPPLKDNTRLSENKDNEEPKKMVEDPPAQQNSKKTSPGFIQDKLVSWGFAKSSSRKIDTVIVHSSYDAWGEDPYSLEGVLDIYKQYGVAAHYIIDREGNVFRLVEDKNTAYHAGVSSVPDGRSNVNDFSIGIELLNTKTDKYTSGQYSSLNKLIEYLTGQYKIKYVLGHDEIAPARKDDPWNFDWEKVEARK